MSSDPTTPKLSYKSSCCSKTYQSAITVKRRNLSELRLCSLLDFKKITSVTSVCFEDRVAKHQPWARYLKGDKIPTKIGSGRVGKGWDQDQDGLPDFLTNRDWDRDGYPEFRDKMSGKIRFFPIFPVIFRSKTPGKVGKSPVKS